jgi:hypothetical protein
VHRCAASGEFAEDEQDGQIDGLAATQPAGIAAFVRRDRTTCPGFRAGASKHRSIRWYRQLRCSTFADDMARLRSG